MGRTCAIRLVLCSVEYYGQHITAEKDWENSLTRRTFCTVLNRSGEATAGAWYVLDS